MTATITTLLLLLLQTKRRECDSVKRLSRLHTWIWSLNSNCGSQFGWFLNKRKFLFSVKPVHLVYAATC